MEVTRLRTTGTVERGRGGTRLLPKPQTDRSHYGSLQGVVDWATVAGKPASFKGRLHAATSGHETESP